MGAALPWRVSCLRHNDWVFNTETQRRKDVKKGRQGEGEKQRQGEEQQGVSLLVSCLRVSVSRYLCVSALNMPIRGFNMEPHDHRQVIRAAGLP